MNGKKEIVMNRDLNKCDKQTRLHEVILALDKAWEAEAEELKAALEQAGIVCTRCNRITERRYNGTVGIGQVEEEAAIADSACLLCIAGIRDVEMERGESILLTDNRKLAKEANAAGMICIGVDRGQNGFFEGAVLVTDNLYSLDPDLLEELYLHEKGLPVVIAETERLIIREMTQSDFADLCRISRQAGMEHLMLPGMRTEDFFNEESLAAYCRMAYRFYGYGLWSVLLKERLQDEMQEGEQAGIENRSQSGMESGLQGGTLIGCCGIQDIDMAEFVKNGTYALELQYMVDEAYRRKGYAEEMCRAVLRYTYVRTEADAICVRCHSDNHAAISLAEKLGFFHKKSDEMEVKFLLRKMT